MNGLGLVGVPQDVSNVATGALYHAIGLGRLGLGKTMFSAQRLTQPIELMLAGGLARSLAGCASSSGQVLVHGL